MKILVVSHRDTENFVLAYMTKAFLRFGHEVEIYAPYNDVNHLFMFNGIDIDIYSIDEFPHERLGDFDLMLVASSAFIDFSWLMDVPLYAVAYDAAYYDEPICGSDFLICRGIDWYPELKCGKRSECTRLVVGDPKHDSWNIDGIKEDPKRFLFIDSGHYPFGMEGKAAAADFILEACRKFPDYELVIKPRFIKGDYNVTHKNTLFLYDVIGERCHGQYPDNLVMLQEHVTLESLIASAHVVITMYTTAYMDAAVLGKPLVILDQLPNEENAQLRIKTHWEPARRIIKGSGCLVDYREAIRYLPDGIRCSEGHLKEHIYSSGDINEKIVRSIEFIYGAYLSKGRFPKIGTYYYDSLPGCCEADPGLDMKKMIALRKKNYLYCMERYFYKNSCFFPERSMLTGYIDRLYSSRDFYKEDMGTLIGLLTEKMMQYADQIPEDVISQDFFLARMIGKDNYRYVFDFPREKVLDVPFYDYVYGRACFEEGRYQDASRYLHEFLAHRESVDFASGVRELEQYQLSGLYYCGLSDMEIGKYAEAEKCFLECERITDNRHKKAQEQLDILHEDFLCASENKGNRT